MTETTPESHESDTLFLGVTKEKVGEIVVSTVATAIAGLVIAVAKGRIDAALQKRAAKKAVETQTLSE
jgi:hypothetical protein